MTWADEQATLAAGVEDTMGVSVVITDPSRSGFNTTTGKPAEFATTEVVKAVLGPLRMERSSAGAGGRNIRFRDFVFRTDSIPGGIQSNFRVAYMGQVWTVVSVEKEAGGEINRARCRMAT